MAAGMGASVGIKVLDQLLDVVGGIKGAIIDLNAQTERATIAFTQLFQSADQARGMVEVIREISTTTPIMTKSLITVTQEFAASGIEVNKFLPLLKDLSNLSSATGNDIQSAFTRIGHAIAQLSTEGQAYQRQLNTIALAGIPIYQALADKLGITITQVREMGREGKLSSDVVINTLHELATSQRFGDVAQAQSHSFVAAFETVRETIGYAIADSFKPFFELLAKGMDATSQFLQTDTWRAWTSAAAAGLQTIFDKIGQVVQVLAPLGKGIRDAFIELNDTGNVNASLANIKDGFAKTMEDILGGLKDMAEEFFGAGYTLIETFAKGMLGASGDVLSSAVDFIAKGIAGFLIGHSPPPEGPLSEIEEGGANLIKTYAAGMAGGLPAVSAAMEQVAKIVSDHSPAEGIKKFQDAFAAATGNVREMQQVGRDVNEVIHGLTAQSHELDVQSRAIRDTQNEIKDAYKAQLDPIERQLAALRNSRDVTLEIRGLDLQRQDIALRIAEEQAKGPVEQRVALQRELREQQQTGTQLSLTRRRQELADEAQSLQPETLGLKFQSDRARLEDQRLTIQERAQELANPDTLTARNQLTSLQDRLAQLQRAKPATDDLQRLDQRIAQLSSPITNQTQMDQLQRQLADANRSPLRGPTQIADLQKQLQEVQTGPTGAAAQLAALKDQQAREAVQARINAPQAKDETAAEAAKRRSDAQLALKEMDLQKQAAVEAQQAQVKAIQDRIAAAQKAAQEEQKDRADQRAAIQERIAALQKETAEAEKKRQQDLQHARDERTELLQKNQLADQDRQKEIQHVQAQIAAAQKRAEIEAERRKNDIAQNERDQKQIELRIKLQGEEEQKEREKARLRLAEIDNAQRVLDIQKQIDDLGDPKALAAIKDAQERNKIESATVDLLKSQEDVNRKIAESPLLQQRQALKEAEQDELAPLHEQQRILEKQRDAIVAQREQWSTLRDTIQDAVGQQRALDQAAKEAAKAKPPNELLPGEGEDPGARGAELRARFQEMGKQIAENLGKGISDWWADHGGEVIIASIGGALGFTAGGVAGAAGGSTLFGPIGGFIGAGIGAAIGGALGTTLGATIAARVKELLGTQGTDILTQIKQRWADFTTELGKINAVADQIGLWKSLGELWRSGGEVLGKLGEVLGRVLGPLIGDSNTNLRMFEFYVGTAMVTIKAFADTMSSVARTISRGLDLLKALGDWLGPKLEGAITGAAKLFLDFGKGASDMFDAFGTGIHDALDLLAGFPDGVKKVFDEIGKEIDTGLAAIVKAWTDWEKERTQAWNTFWDDVGSTLHDALDSVGKFFGDGIAAIQKAWDDWGTERTKAWNDFWDGIGAAINDAWEEAKRTVIAAFAGLQESWDKWNKERTDAWNDFWGTGPGGGPGSGKGVIGAVTGAVDTIKKTIGTNENEGLWGGITKTWNGIKDSVIGIVGKDEDSGMRGDLKQKWAALTNLGEIIDKIIKPAVMTAWNNLKTDVGTFFDNLGTTISQKIDEWKKGGGALLNSIFSVGSAILEELGKGIQSGLEGTWKWIKENLVDALPNKIKEWLGIHSPSSVFEQIGGSIMEGLVKGMQDKFSIFQGVANAIQGVLGNIPGIGGSTAQAAGQGSGTTAGQGAITAIRNLPGLDTTVAGRYGSGRLHGTSEGALDAAPQSMVNQWIAQAMGITGVGQQWTSALQRLIMVESSNDPNIFNDNDSNYRAGTPSIGLMQTIGPTFASYKLGGYDDIQNPVDNIIAGIRYIQQYYGGIERLPVFSGAHQAYDNGGWVTGPTVGFNLRTGQPVGFALNGIPERVLSGPESAQYGRASQPVVVQVNGVGLDEVAEEVVRRLRNMVALGQLSLA